MIKLFCFRSSRDKYPKMWKITRLFTHINTFVYRDKRIYVELDDMNKVYSVKETDNIVCLRVPLRSWTRLRSARMSQKIIDSALDIIERHEVEKHRKREELVTDNGQNDLVNRIIQIEDTLKLMQATLKQISDKLDEK